jgi:hypothetical protein
MKSGILAAAMALAGATSAYAVGFHDAPNAQLFTCARNPVSRVATLAAEPSRCCDGRLQCPQFLSTTTLLKPKNDPHT